MNFDNFYLVTTGKGNINYFGYISTCQVILPWTRISVFPRYIAYIILFFTILNFYLIGGRFNHWGHCNWVQCGICPITFSWPFQTLRQLMSRNLWDNNSLLKWGCIVTEIQTYNVTYGQSHSWQCKILWLSIVRKSWLSELYL